MRCLLVDDSHRFLAAGRARLEAAAAEVVTAMSADDALAALDGGMFDVALVDIQLGGASGFVAARRIHAHAPDLAIVMISARDVDDYGESPGGDAVTGFIPKASLSVARILETLEPSSARR
jgi:DNA-binding response OmpR family regulator